MQKQQPAVVLTADQTNSVYPDQRQTYPAVKPNAGDPNYNRSHSVTSGVILIIAGLLSIALNVIDIVFNTLIREDDKNRWCGFKTDDPDEERFYCSLGYVGHGLWTGLVFIIAGIVGVVAGAKKTRCTIVAFLALAVIAQCTAGAQFSLGVLSAHGSASYETYDYDSSRRCKTDFCIKIRVLIAMEALLAVTAVLGFAGALWGSVTCCINTCGSLHPTAAYYGTPFVVMSTKQQPASIMQPPAWSAQYPNAVLPHQQALAGPPHGQAPQHRKR